MRQYPDPGALGKQLSVLPEPGLSRWTEPEVSGSETVKTEHWATKGQPGSHTQMVTRSSPECYHLKWATDCHVFLDYNGSVWPMLSLGGEFLHFKFRSHLSVNDSRT